MARFLLTRSGAAWSTNRRFSLPHRCGRSYLKDGKRAPRKGGPRSHERCQGTLELVEGEEPFYRAKPLRGEPLRGNLSRADLSEADLLNANLHNTNLLRAILFRADLVRADLSEAILAGATLTGADLSTASLTQEELEPATRDGNTRLPPDLSPPRTGEDE
jgi:hypothetical protein